MVGEIRSIRPGLRDPAVALLSDPPPLRGSTIPSLQVTDCPNDNINVINFSVETEQIKEARALLSLSFTRIGRGGEVSLLVTDR